MNPAFQELFKVRRKVIGEKSPHIIVESRITGKQATAPLDNVFNLLHGNVAVFKLARELEPNWIKIAALREIKINRCPVCGEQKNIARRIIAAPDPKGEKVICEISCLPCHSNGTATMAVELEGDPEAAGELWNSMVAPQDTNEQEMGQQNE